MPGCPLPEGKACCAEDARRCNCAALEETLSLLPGAQRMVVGHTIQEAGINSACNDRVFRIDVGLSAGCGDGMPEVQTPSLQWGCSMFPRHLAVCNVKCCCMGWQVLLGIYCACQLAKFLAVNEIPASLFPGHARAGDISVF